MSVSPAFRDFAVEQLGRVVPITARKMFGGIGLYSEGLFFALINDDVLYLKVDDTNRPDFEAEGMGPFRPYGDDSHVMQYYELQADLLENTERLRPWVEKSIAVARRARRR